MSGSELSTIPGFYYIPGMKFQEFLLPGNVNWEEICVLFEITTGEEKQFPMHWLRPHLTYLFAPDTFLPTLLLIHLQLLHIVVTWSVVH